jgi:predicted permease
LNAILITVLPVFGMIMLGLVFAKARLIDQQAARGITSFVFNLAIPALLFKTIATMSPQDGAPWGLWLVFFSGLAITWLTTAVVSQFFENLKPSGGAVASMAAGFGNLAFLGTPLALSHFGSQVAVPLGMILSVHAPVLWTAATLHRELAVHSGAPSFRSLGRQLFLNLAKNAIIVALLAGAIWRATALGLNPIIDKMLSMLSDASVPTALFALGLSLAAYSLRGNWPATLALIALKMLFTPLAVFLIIRFALPLPPLWAKVAVLFAAMPSGANAFLFAVQNDEAVAPVSAAIAMGTGFSALTASILLYLMDANYI